MGSPELRGPIDYSIALESVRQDRRSQDGHSARVCPPTLDSQICPTSCWTNEPVESTRRGTGLPEHVGEGCADSVCTIGYHTVQGDRDNAILGCWASDGGARAWPGQRRLEDKEALVASLFRRRNLAQASLQVLAGLMERDARGRDTCQRKP